MGAVEQSYEAVESYLSTLERSYDSFGVNQTTLAVEPRRYERERERALAGSVDVYTRVVNDSGEVLRVHRESDLVLPATRTATEPFERVARAAVEEQTGVDCRIDGLDEVTILGIRNRANGHDSVYRLAIVFEASPRTGSTNGDAVWHSGSQEAALSW